MASKEQINEDLRIFLEKHGITPDNDVEENLNDIPNYPRGNNFYPDAVDEDMDLRNDDDNDFGLDIEDDIAILQKSNQYNKKSPNSMTGSTRKGANLANISNTVHGNNR